MVEVNALMLKCFKTIFLKNLRNGNALFAYYCASIGVMV